MRLHVLGSVVVGVALFASPARADVKVTIADGRVTLTAKDATIRQILVEWARVGQTRIVNVERVSGSPVSIELTDVPEAQALDVVLRSVSGYLAAPRSVVLPNASRYDRIYLLPTSSGTPVRAGAPASAAAPAFAPPPPLASADDQSDDEVPRQVPVPAPQGPQPGGPRGPVFNTFPQPQTPRQAITAAPAPPPAAAPTPASYPAPTAPVGVPTPGMVVPTPQQPGQAQPGSPGQR
jgi:hypothetical protein